MYTAFLATFFITMDQVLNTIKVIVRWSLQRDAVAASGRHKMLRHYRSNEIKDTRSMMVQRHAAASSDRDNKEAETLPFYVK